MSMNNKSAISIVFILMSVVFGGTIIYMLGSDKNFFQKSKTNWQWKDEWGPSDTVPGSSPSIDIGITANSYHDAIQKSGDTGKPVLVIFHADWCDWCKKMKRDALTDSKVKNVLQNYILVKVDIDREKNIAGKFNVKQIPAYVITNYKEGNLKSGNGYQNAVKFSAWLNNPELYHQPKKNIDKLDDKKEKKKKKEEDKPKDKKKFFRKKDK